jgi:hypothetical protein
MSKDQQNQQEILDELRKMFSETFNSFAEARAYLDHGSVILKKIRLLMVLRNVHDAIMDDPNGDAFFETEQQLSKVDKDSMILRSFLAELEKAQIKKSTKSSVVDYELPPTFH